MPLIETKTSLFDLEANVLVNPVNCVGVMGKGLAKEFAKRYPEILPIYKEACSNFTLSPGQSYVIDLVSCGIQKDNVTHIVLFTTKGHWKNDSRLCWIETGLDGLKKRCDDYFKETDVIAIPKVGAGLGGLNEQDVVAMIKYKLTDVKQTIYLSI